MLAHFKTRRAKATFVGAFAASCLMLAMALLSAAQQIGRPFPGFIIWQNLVVPAISAPSWPTNLGPIPFRSVIVSADGARVRNAQTLRALAREAPVGTPIRYTFRRGEDTVTRIVPTSLLRWSDILPTYLPYLLNAIALFASALAVFYFKPRLPATRAFLVLGLALGGVLALAIDLFSSFWFERMYFCLESLLPGALLHFALCFPEPKRIAQQHPALEWVVYLPFIPLAVLQNIFLSSDPERHLMVNDWAYAAMAGAGLVVIISLVHTFVRSPNTLAQQQVRIVLIGMAVATVIPSLGLMSIIVLDVDIPMNLLSPFYVVGPLSIGYAIARYDLFQVDRFLRTGLVYGALSLVVFLSYAAMVVAVERWLGAERRLPAGVVPLYLLLLLVFFNPLRAGIQRLVDRLFHRQAYNYRDTVETTSQALTSFLDTDRIATTVLNTLTEVMSVEWGVLFVFVDSIDQRRLYSRPYEWAATAARLFPPGDATISSIVAGRQLVTRYKVPRGGKQGDSEDIDLQRLDEAKLMLPAYFEDEPLGLLMLGEKKSGAYYSAEDINLIQTLVNQSALAIKNASAYEIIRHTQDELVRAERLAAVGELGAAVAHGIRNPLAGIRAAAQVAREDVSSDHPLLESLDDIIAEADRLENQVRTLLNFTRPFEPNLIWADLNMFVEEFAANIRRRIPAGVHFTVHQDSALPAVQFDLVQMTEVLEALTVNALEAMSSGGQLTIQTLLERRDGRGSEALVRVSDTGPGIDATQLQQVFTLFYTTKASGTGIGLAMAKRLIERQGGTIEIASQLGAGTVFTIRLHIPEAVTS